MKQHLRKLVVPAVLFVDMSAGSSSRYKMFDMYWDRKSDR